MRPSAADCDGVIHLGGGSVTSASGMIPREEPAVASGFLDQVERTIGGGERGGGVETLIENGNTGTEGDGRVGGLPRCRGFGSGWRRLRGCRRC
jgi:hypothetical protein